MSQYYQSFNDSSSPPESSDMKRHKDAIWRRRAFIKPDLLIEGQLKVLYFFSYMALVCVAHFSKLFYLEAGLSVTQISVLQCIFYLARYCGFSTIVSMEKWMYSTNRGVENGCLRHLRSILVCSVCVSTALWVLLPLKHMQNFETLIGVVFIASLTISTSHGFLEMIAEDTIFYTKTRIDYTGLRFYGLLGWGLGSIGIGAIVDAVSLDMIFYMFAVFQFFFLSCLCCWFPQRHESKTDPHPPHACEKICSGGGMFNVYFFIFLFGMIHSLPEILMLHLKLEFNIKAVFLGVLISAMAFGELFGYLMLSNTGSESLFVVGTLTMVFTGVRLLFWEKFTSEYYFLASEFGEYALMAIFWVSILQTTKSIVTFVPSIQRDLQSSWHYQSLAFGVLLYGTLYDALGAEECFKMAAYITAGLLLYFYITFLCVEKRTSYNFEERLTQDEESGGPRLLECGSARNDFTEEPTFADKFDETDLSSVQERDSGTRDKFESTKPSETQRSSFGEDNYS